MDGTYNLKEIVENILNRERVESEKIKSSLLEEYNNIIKTKRTMDQYMNDKEILYLSNNMPEVIGSGDTQKLLRLNEQVIAKIPVIKFPNHLLMNNYEGDIEKSAEIWKELGFNVPEHIFYYVNFEDKDKITFEDKDKITLENKDKITLENTRTHCSDKPRVIIASDLSENERYKIITYHPQDIKNLKNKGALLGEYEEGFRRIKDIEANPTTYQLQAFGHVDMNGSKDKAIRHMFLVKIDPEKNTGELLLADIDHLLISKH